MTTLRIVASACSGIASFMATKQLLNPSANSALQAKLVNLENENYSENRTLLEQRLLESKTSFNENVKSAASAAVYGYCTYAVATGNAYTPVPYLVAAYATKNFVHDLAKAYQGSCKVQEAVTHRCR